MNTFLISLGAALVLVLTAALVGPSFVDWNTYRVAAEAEGARLIGRPVTIKGDLDVSVLPTPVVRAGEVVLLDETGVVPLVEAEAVELNLDLATLITGRFELTDLVLIAPRVRADRLAGALALVAGGQPSASSPRAPSLRRIEARDATVTVANPLGGEPRSVSEVDVQVNASTPTGPFRVTGHYGEPGGEDDTSERLSFSATVGSIERTGPVKVAGRFELDQLGVLTLDGEISDVARAPRYAGRVKVDYLVDSETGDGGRLTFDAVTDIGAGEAELSQLEVSAAEGEHSLALAGSGRASWGGPSPRFSADLKSRQIDLDAAFGDNAPTAVAGAVGEIASSLREFVMTENAQGRLQVAVGGVIWRGELSRDLSASLSIAPDAVTIANLHGSLPGETEVTLSGRMDLTDETFAGNVVADTIEPARLARWVAAGDGGGLADIVANSRGKLSIRGEVDADRDTVTLAPLEGFVDANAFTGMFGVERGEGGTRLHAVAAFDSFDLDRFLPPDAGLLDLLALTSPARETDAAQPDIDVEFRAKRLTLLGREAEGVELIAAYRDGAVDIDSLNIGTFAGSGLSVNGRIERTPGGPVGSIEAQVSSQSLPRLVEGLRLPRPEVVSKGLLDGLNVQVAELAVSVDAGDEAAPGGTTIAVSGDLAGVAIDASVRSDAAPADFASGMLDVTASIETSDASYLFGPDGVYPLLDASGPAGPGRVSLTASGRVGEGLDGTLIVDAFGTVAEAKGRVGPDAAGVGGEISADVGDVDRLAAALGLVPVRRSRPASMTVTASVGSGGNAITFDDITASLAGNDISATASVTRADPPLVTVDFEADRASLPWIVASVFSSRDDDPSSAAGALRLAVWPTDLVNVAVLRAATVKVGGAVGALDLGGGLDLADARLEARLDDGKLSLTRLDGRLDDGEVAITGTMRGVDHALVVDGALDARQVPLSRLLVDGRGRDLIAGRVDIKGDFAARGRSLLSLVSSLEGTGSASVHGASVTRFDLETLLDVAAVAEAGPAVDAALIAGRARDTPFAAGPGEITAANGRIKIGPLEITALGLAGEATSFVDVPSRRLDQELVLEEQGAGGLHLALVHAGPFGEVGREVEITNLGELGSARWTEPFDDFAVPPPPPPAPEPEPEPTARDEAERSLPPVGLIDKEIIDLPILQDVAPGNPG